MVLVAYLLTDQRDFTFTSQLFGEPMIAVEVSPTTGALLLVTGRLALLGYPLRSRSISIQRRRPTLTGCTSLYMIKTIAGYLKSARI